MKHKGDGVALDRIVLEGLEFHGYHGVFEEEKRFGARFVVDLELRLPLPTDDRLDATVDYGAVYRFVQDEVTGVPYRLIETLAQRIATGALERFASVRSLVVRVHKPHAPLPGVVRDVYVEVERHRSA